MAVETSIKFPMYKMVTIRMNVIQHKTLKKKAHQSEVSMNTYCLNKLGLQENVMEETELSEV